MALLMGLLGATVLMAVPVRAQQPVAATEPRVAAPTDLPLIEMPPKSPGELLTVMISGDGGWAAIDKGVSGRIYEGGQPLVGLNALKYFWSRKQPEQTSRDLERILRYYLAAWNRREVVLVGYSRGADVLPFMITRLPEDLRRRIHLVALIGPSTTVDLKFHVGDWWGTTHHDTDLPVLPEAEKLFPATRVLCLYGTDENDSVCPALGKLGAEVVPLKGAHHFDGGYDALGDIVLRAMLAPSVGA